MAVAFHHGMYRTASLLINRTPAHSRLLGTSFQLTRNRTGRRHQFTDLPGRLHFDSGSPREQSLIIFHR